MLAGKGPRGSLLPDPSSRRFVITVLAGGTMTLLRQGYHLFTHTGYKVTNTRLTSFLPIHSINNEFATGVLPIRVQAYALRQVEAYEARQAQKFVTVGSLCHT